MSNKSQKIILKMNEDNQISFNLSIEGYSSDSSLTSKPEIRFALTEGSGDFGFLLPAKFEDGKVSVDIPSSGVFKENKEYSGKLEVFLGNRYFKPAELMIEFHRPLEVKAEIVAESVQIETPVSVASTKAEATQKPAAPVSKPAAAKPVAKPPQRTISPQRPATKILPEKKISVADEIEELLLEEERLKKLLEEKIEKQQKVKPFSKQEQAMKDKLKRLFRDA